MKTFKKMAAQGDILIIAVDTIPENVKPAVAERGNFIIAHSETGHHHVVDAGVADRFIDEMNEFVSYLSVASDAEVKHLRDHDTHASLGLSPGVYEVRQQREYVPEGYRRAAD